MSKKIRIIVSSVLFIPLVWLFIGWVRRREFIMGSGDMSDIPVKTPSIISGPLITLLIIVIVYLISMGKSKNSQLKMWGIAVLVSSAPLADALGFVYAILDKNPFAWFSALILFPLFLIAGLSLLLTGFIRKNPASE